MRTFLALLATTALTAPAFADGMPPAGPSQGAIVAANALAERMGAENVPVPSPVNPNMRTVAYSRSARFFIIGNINRQTTITFAEGEQVARVLIGDADAEGQTWEAPNPDEVKDSPLENVVYLTPRKAGYTSITVIMKGPRGVRTYQFAALARSVPKCASYPICDDPEATYGLTFTYPDDEAADRAAKAKAAADERRARWEATRPQRDAQQALFRNASLTAQIDMPGAGVPMGIPSSAPGSACVNWLFEGDANSLGRERILPEQPYNTATETVFLFPGNRELPTFYTLSADGKTEMPIIPVKREVGGETRYAIQSVAKEIRLRLGEAVVYVYNRGPNMDACVPKTGTRSHRVRRIVKPPMPRLAATNVGAPE